MKKLYLSTIFIAGSLYLTAQEKIAGGNMEDASKWTVLDVTQAQTSKVAAEVTFNYTDDTPADGAGGCLHVSGDGRCFVYQKVTLTPGKTYALSAAFKAVSGDDVYQYYWNEVNIVNREPFLDADHDDFGAGKGEYQLGMHYWKSINDGGTTGDSTVAYDRMDNFDGLLQNSVTFAFLGVAKGGTADSLLTSPRDPSFSNKNFRNGAVIFTLPDTSKTNWYVLIKSGGNAGKDVLYDEISLKEVDLSQSSVNNLANVNSAFDVYPNPVSNGIVNIKSKSTGKINYSLYNTAGMLVKSGVASEILNIGNLNKGVFILHLESGSFVEQRKLIVK